MLDLRDKGVDSGGFAEDDPIDGGRHGARPRTGKADAGGDEDAKQNRFHF
jgi:hypothetical protein